MQKLQKDVIIDDVMLTLWSLRYLAAKLHRSPNTIKFWEHQKILPRPIVKTSEGRRWYTTEEVNLYVRLAEEEQIRNGKPFGKFSQRAFFEQAILAKTFFKRVAEAKRG